MAEFHPITTKNSVSPKCVILFRPSSILGLSEHCVNYRNWKTTNDAKFVGFWVSFRCGTSIDHLAVTTDPHWSVMMMIGLCLFVG